MDTTPSTSYTPGYRSFQKFHPLCLLAQVASRKTTGCLRIFNSEICWSVYLDQGELIYATNSAEPFDRLDRHLRQLSRRVPAIVSAVRVQVRLLFENSQEHLLQASPDYQAICWLLDQQYINLEQAAYLIESIAREAIEPLLLMEEASYEILERNGFEKWINLCQFDLRSFVENCQNQQKKSQFAGKTPASLVPFPKPAPQNTLKLNANLPKLATPASSNPQRPAVPPSGAREMAERKLLQNKYTIVCIDDSPTILKTIKTYLDDMSFNVVAIHDPLKALMQVIRNQPDIILMDIGMPNLDGYALCSLLRRNQGLKNTPIIMVTGNSGIIDRARAKLVGASGYLTKPFTQSDLLKIVFKHLA
jgi:twitching motility two-component system response regulator PilG